MTGQEPAEITSSLGIQRTDGFDKVHTEPDLLLLEGTVIFMADEAGSAVSGSRTAHAAHAQERR